ncbi:PcfB family protein [Butyrivibrio sp. INlla16]|uniref:PcfB family protein n=1 Tax=Butyrivibrio sp. INlla16 TaxID=1520807 RepID=UPI0008854A6E|nr:PcfB family protein [Butyrivibrio sp. INlla16]SDB62253.1 Protein of unknown function [Butyrivibrio sp. INlla16]
MGAASMTDEQVKKNEETAKHVGYHAGRAVVKGGVKATGFILKITVVPAGKTLGKAFAEAVKSLMKKNDFLCGKIEQRDLKKFEKASGNLTDVELAGDDANLKNWNKVCRKYGIKYCVKTDNTVQPKKYHVFIKATDQDLMKHAFKDFVSLNEKTKAKEAAKQAKKQEMPKRSFNKLLKIFKEMADKLNKNRDKDKHRSQGRER